MSLLEQLNPGIRLYDRLTGQERSLHQVEIYPGIVYLSFLNPQTGAVERQPFPTAELETRFEVAHPEGVAFRADPETVRLATEAYRLQHAYLFNPMFVTETSLIDLLPHQLAAVYGTQDYGGDVSGGAESGQPGMLACVESGTSMWDAPRRLRFLLADDAGAGKTIMAGLVIRELLLRRAAQRVLVVAPAGLVGNWQTELGRFFGLRFPIIAGRDVTETHNPFHDPQNALAIISVDTLARERIREAYIAAVPYDLVIFDEAHKLSATREADLTPHKSLRYEAAEMIAAQGRHLLLMTATPHMGKDDPYFYLWRLLEPTLFATPSALQRLAPAQRQRYLLRRMKEEMVKFTGESLYTPRSSSTVTYPLNPLEWALYKKVTDYCDEHWGRAKLSNRSAARLALSVLQRRLASSTLSILRSLRRREEKLAALCRELEAGLLDEAALEARQQQLPEHDLRDEKTADEEEILDGQEESERQDEDLAGATDAANLAEARAELAEVRALAAQAEQVYAQQQESKFEQLWQALEGYPDAKALIFTEFRDTLDFLVGRLEGKGLAGKIAVIHGGMDYQERQAQRERFRDPQGARILVATDAAGEGINLQFCWLLINYDIPWNPARLEQRMGRVHRYRQEKPVVLLNVVAEETREGRVLKVLLDKLENIRKELGDKVFDVVGLQFSRKPLPDLIAEAVLEGRDAEIAEDVERELTQEHVAHTLEQQQRNVAATPLRAVLEALKAQREVAELRRMMPAYIQRFFELAAPQVDVTVHGDLDKTFALEGPASVEKALTTYPPYLREMATFQRELAQPDWGADPKAIYLYPGEPVFDAVMTLFLGQAEPEAQRGAVFLDAETSEPYLFYLGKVTLLRAAETDAGEVDVVAEQMVGLRRYADGRIEPAPAHLLMELFLPETTDNTDCTDKKEKAVLSVQSVVKSLVTQSLQRGPVEAFLHQTFGAALLQRRRQEEESALPEQLKQVRAAYNLRHAELLQQRQRLQERVEKNIPAAASKLRTCEAELAGLDEARRAAIAAAQMAPVRLALGPARLYAQALVLPMPPEQAEERRDVDAEKVAMAYVRRREESQGSVVQDVSSPHLKAGFDYKIVRADGEVRYVEVKGCSKRSAIEMEANEWAQAANYRQKYWLYVVYDCATTPDPHFICDPFEHLLAKQTGALRINVSQILAASENRK